jgi:hypothetical protein
VQALPITGGNLVGTLTSDFDISSRSNITSKHAIIGDHVFAFRTGQGVGGAIGSWDTTSGKGAGFHYDAGANAMDFGPADPSTGNLLSTQFRIDAIGNTYTPNVVAAGGGLQLFGDPFFGLNQSGTLRRLDWAGDGAGNPRYYQSSIRPRTVTPGTDFRVT